VQRLVVAGGPVVMAGLAPLGWLGCAVAGAGKSYEVQGSSEAAGGMCCALQERCIQMMYGVSQWQCFCGVGNMVVPVPRVALLLHCQLGPSLLETGLFSVL